jgi:prepilin-type processing-associated H-X9-DG protein
MNSHLSGVEEKNIRFPNETIIIGDGDGASPQSTASYAIGRLPQSWRQSTNSPATRHLGGANYVFLDGHIKVKEAKYVKWLKSDEVTRTPASDKMPMYAFQPK